MKLSAAIFAALLLAAPHAPGTAAQDADLPAAVAEGEAQSATGVAAAAPDVTLTLCVASGDVVVRGGDRGEVRARAAAGWLELRPAERSAPARSIEVLMADSAEASPGPGGCSLSGSVELEVPRGARVWLKVREGDVDVSDVAEARVESMNGDVALRRIARSAEVDNLSGSIFLRESAGRVSLRTMSGDIEAVNVGANAPADGFSARSTSGSVTLEGVRHARVEAGTVSGDVEVSGAPARGGAYDLKTFSGDVLLLVPPDSSFRFNASVAAGGEILSDFSVKHPNGAEAAKVAPLERLSGVIGSGGADVNLTSFNGTVRLKRQ